MAQIAAFSGVHYNPTSVPLEKVIAPPYDVISPAQQDALYALHPANIVRLMLNKDQPEDSETANRYTRAAAFLKECLESGTLVRDEAPALYEYVQKFEDPLQPGRIITRKTLFVALLLEPYENGVVLPHEETHPKAKADRLNLMRATNANPEPIYGLYEDPNLAVARTLEQSRGDQAPLLSAALPGRSGQNSEEHILYRHSDPRIIRNVSDFFEARRVWIADGHHRYETALNYRKERREAENHPGDAQPYDYIFIGLSAFEDSGLVVLPTHRLIKNVSEARLDQLKLQLERFFTVEEMTVAQLRDWIKEETPEQKRFGIVTRTGGYALTLRDLNQAEAALDQSHCPAWRRLDVTILQALVLDRTLGISWAELAHTPDVAYTRDEDEAVARVQNGDFQLACLLQNPTVTEVRDVAAAGDKMPQKSTFFYPKLWSGMLLRTLDRM